MRIAFTLHTDMIEGAGAPTVVVTLAKKLRARGHETSVFTLSDLPAALPDRARAAAFPVAVAARFRGKPKPDVVDASTGDAWLYAGLRGRRGPLLVTHSHGLEHVVHDAFIADVGRGRQHASWKYPIYNGGFRLWEVRQSLVRADLCLFLNQYDLTYATDRLGVDPGRAHVLPNGCDDVLLDRHPTMAPPLGDLRIVQVGSYLARKGTAYTAEALNIFLSRHPGARLRFLGTGVPDDVVYADFDPGVRAQIDVTARFDRRQLGTMLDDQHVILFPSLAEGFGLALLEGMACGLAPVSSDIPGPTEIVTGKGDGLLVPPADGGAILAALEQLAGDHGRLQSLRAAARRRAEQFRWSAIAERREALYRSGIERRKQEAGR